jgi:hypothetical protein
MQRQFITKTDIDAMADAGQQVLEIDDCATVTDLARDQAMQRGVRIVRRAGETRAAAPSGPTSGPSAAPEPVADGADLRARVRALVIARLGGTPEGLDAVIDRAVSASDPT